MTTGRIVWHELVSPDADRAAGFYADLLDWGREGEWAETGPGWERRLTVESGGRHRPVATVTQLPRDKEEAGDARPSLWLVYVHVGRDPAAMDDAVGRAREAGVEMKSPRMGGSAGDGRYAFHLLGGTAFTVPLAHNRVGRFVPRRGDFCWDQLTVHPRRLNGLSGHLEATFGWTLGGGDGGRGTFRHLSGDSKEPRAVAGWHLMAVDRETSIPDHWLPFVYVDDVDARVERAEKLGGTVVVPRPPVDEGDERDGDFAVVCDPTGGVLGLRQWVN